MVMLTVKVMVNGNDKR